MFYLLIVTLRNLTFRNSWFVSVVIVLCGSFLFFSILNFGNQQFGGMDGGVLVNAAWQQYLGYVPYRDFITVVPPGFLLGAQWAFRLFGPSWNSLVLLTALFAVITFVLQFIIFIRFGIPVLLAAFISLAIQIPTTVSTSFWWYNQMTAITASLFLSCIFLILKRDRTRVNWILLVLTTVILLVSKPNVAVVALTGGYFVLLFHRESRRFAYAALISSVILVVFVLLAHQVNPWTVADIYSSGSERFTRAFLLSNFYATDQESVLGRQFVTGLSVLIVISLGLWVTTIRKNKLLQQIRAVVPYVMLTLTSALATFVGIATNNDHTMVEVPSLLVGTFLLLHILRQKLFHKQSVVKRVIGGVMLLLFFLPTARYTWHAYTYAQNRYRIKDVGDGVYYQGPPTTIVRLESYPFFSTLFGSPYLIQTLGNVRTLIETIKQVTILDEHLYFGPRLDFAYAVFSIRPPKGLPLWWGETSESGGVPRRKTDDVVERFKNSKIQLAIFLGGDFTFLPSQLVTWIKENYSLYQFGKSYLVGSGLANVDVYMSKDTPHLQALVASIE